MAAIHASPRCRFGFICCSPNECKEVNAIFLPPASNCTPSFSSSLRLRSTASPLPQVPLKPPICRSAAITRCHGTDSLAEQPESGASGFLRMHWPTARAHPPVARATSPYVATLPGGMVRTSAKTEVWKAESFIDRRLLVTADCAYSQSSRSCRNRDGYMLLVLSTWRSVAVRGGEGAWVESSEGRKRSRDVNSWTLGPAGALRQTPHSYTVAASPAPRRPCTTTSVTLTRDRTRAEVPRVRFPFLPSFLLHFLRDTQHQGNRYQGALLAPCRYTAEAPAHHAAHALLSSNDHAHGAHCPPTPPPHPTPATSS